MLSGFKVKYKVLGLLNYSFISYPYKNTFFYFNINVEWLRLQIKSEKEINIEQII